MSSFVSLIRSIYNSGFTQRELVLKLRIVRSYTLPSFGNPNQIRSYEIVCHDRSGDRIHGTIRPSDFRRVKVDFSEGQMIAVQYVVVDDNNMKFKTTSCRFKFITSSKSRILNMDDNEFPYYRFDFRALSDITDPSNINQALLIGNFIFVLVV